MLAARCRQREMPFVSLPKSSIGRGTSVQATVPIGRSHSIRRLFNTEDLACSNNLLLSAESLVRYRGPGAEMGARLGEQGHGQVRPIWHLMVVYSHIYQRSEAIGQKRTGWLIRRH